MIDQVEMDECKRKQKIIKTITSPSGVKLGEVQTYDIIERDGKWYLLQKYIQSDKDVWLRLIHSLETAAVYTGIELYRPNGARYWIIKLFDNTPQTVLPLFMERVVENWQQNKCRRAKINLRCTDPDAWYHGWKNTVTECNTSLP